MAWKGTRPSAFADTLEKTLTKRQKDIAAFALQQVIFGSPFDEGAYKGNHRVSVNGQTYEFDPSQLDTNGQATLNDGMSKIGAISQAFGVVYIQNNAPYGERLENGWSQQAPQGVYDIAFNNTAERFR